MALLAILGVWSNHFEAVFQDNDFHIIVNNRALQDPGNIPHFFANPLLYADQPELAEYRPLALASLAADRWLAQSLNPGVFQADSFLWFMLDVFVFGIFCMFIPGGGWRRALFAAALFGFHPVVGETLNYVSRRGDLIGTFFLLAGLVFWIVWPRHLPAKIIQFDGVPRTDWEATRKELAPVVNSQYRSLVEAPLHLYLLPVILGMLADPGVAVFPLLMLAYILLFDREPKYGKVWRRVLPSAVVCSLCQAAQLAWTWKYASGYRLPAVDYWITQPWVVLRSLWTFIAPVNLTAVSDLPVFQNIWSPLALVGFAGLAGLIYFARWLGSKEEWRTVSFGLWWFLVALLPTSLIPQRAAEADYRLYLPAMGLAIAVTGASWAIYERFAASPRPRLQVNIVATTVAAALLALCCWQTWVRTGVWSSQNYFWEDVTLGSPRSGRAFIEYAVALRAEGQTDRAYSSLQHAVSLISAASPVQDAPDEILLARAFDLFDKDKEAVQHFQRALQADPNYAPAWAAYAEWLLLHDHVGEAFDAASRALKISPWNTQARHTMLEFYSRNSDWADLKKHAEALLRLDPTDPDGRRSLEVAEAGFTELKNAEQKAKTEPTVDDFLNLSIQYYRVHRFEDAISACKGAAKLQPDLAEPWSNMAASYYALGKTDDAINALREALRLRPDLTLVKSNLDFLLSRQSQNQPAGAR